MSPTMEELRLLRDKTPAQRQKRTRVKRTPEEHEAKMVGQLRQAYGLGPKGATCGQCVHLYTVAYAGKYFKCELGPQSRAETTDWRKRWRACGKFQYDHPSASHG